MSINVKEGVGDVKPSALNPVYPGELDEGEGAEDMRERVCIIQKTLEKKTRDRCVTKWKVPTGSVGEASL